MVFYKHKDNSTRFYLVDNRKSSILSPKSRAAWKLDVHENGCLFGAFNGGLYRENITQKRLSKYVSEAYRRGSSPTGLVKINKSSWELSVREMAMLVRKK